MIKERQSWQALDIEYIGSPDLTFTLDGETKIDSLTLPENTKRKSRLITLPNGSVGYTPQLQLSTPNVVRYSFRGQPVGSFSENNIYAYYEITFTDSIRSKISLDSVDVRPNNSTQYYWDFTAREGFVQDKRRIYYPPLSYGYIPHYDQDLSVEGKDGVLVDFRVVALPSRFHKLERHHSEYQITYEGNVQLEIYLDGTKLVEETLKEQSIPQDGGVVTHKGYFPSNSIGQVLQYIQISGEGEIFSFETDQTLLDLEAPKVEQPA